MNSKVYEAKTKEEALEKALEDLKVEENEVFYSTEEIKGKLFKAGSVKVKIVTMTDVVEYLKNYLTELLKNMGMEVSFETKIREKQITIKMFSDNNGILIGKNGQTLKALQTILGQVVYKEIKVRPQIILDVENYKDKQIKRLERLAKNVAREVKHTGVEIVMDNMNSYERRIVHNIISKFDGITTKSEGEEPNRHIVVSKSK